MWCYVQPLRRCTGSGLAYGARGVSVGNGVLEADGDLASAEVATRIGVVLFACTRDVDRLGACCLCQEGGKEDQEYFQRGRDWPTESPSMVGSGRVHGVRV